MPAKKNSVEERITIPPLNIKTFVLTIVGDSPLIVHAWSDKAKRMMLEKQTKKATAGKEIRKPYVEFADSLYWLTPKPDLDGLSDEKAAEIIDKAIPNAKFGFPTVGIKAAAASGGFRSKVTKNKTDARAAFHLQGIYAVIEGTPQIREDMVKIGQGTADLRYRGEFPTWQTSLTVEYNERAMSAEQIVNLFNIGGFACGIGEWRPEKGGDYGRYHVKIG